MRAVARISSVGNALITVVSVRLNLVRAIVHIIKTRNAVRHTIRNIERTSVMIVTAAKVNEFAALRIRRAKQRVDFRSTNFPRFLTAGTRRRKPRCPRTGRRVDLRLQRGLFKIR